jgi:hypothetical protein
MAKKTELKIANILNDIFIKAKSKIAFNPKEMQYHHHIGSGFFTILKKSNLLHKVSEGQYIYIGKNPDYHLIKKLHDDYILYGRVNLNNYIAKESKNIIKGTLEFTNKDKENDERCTMIERINNHKKENPYVVMVKENRNLRDELNQYRQENDRLKDELYRIKLSIATPIKESKQSIWNIFKANNNAK